MGKTFRLDSKYENELAKHTKSSRNSERLKTFEKKEKPPKKSKKSKRFLKGNFLQRIWPFTNEDKKGRHKV